MKGSGGEGKWWRRKVMMKGSGYDGKWRGREVITKGSGDKGEWWRWEVVTMGSVEEGKWWRREVVTMGSGEEGKCWGREVVTKGSGYDGKWRGREVVRRGSGDKGKWWRWEVVTMGSGDKGKWWCMHVAWAMFWGGSWSTKPCFFRIKWLQPAMKGTSSVRRLRLRSFRTRYVPSMCFATSGCFCGPACIYAHGNTRWQQSCSHSNAICNHRFKKRIELRPQEQPLVAEHRGGTDWIRNDPNRNRRTHEVPFIVACSHFTRKKTRSRALASSSKRSPCMPMQHSCSHYNAICNHSFRKHCNGCMNVAWALFWGGSRSTKPCISPHLCVGFLFLILYPAPPPPPPPPPPPRLPPPAAAHTITYNNFTHTNLTYTITSHTSHTHTHKLNIQ